MSEDFKYTHRYDLLDLLAEALAALLLFGQVFMIILALRSLPDLIPNHFNGHGVANGYGSKYTIIGPFVFSIILYTILTVLSRFPQFYRSSFQKDDKATEYKLTVKMILSLKPILMLVFFLITYFMIQTAQLKLTEYLNYLVAGILVIVFSHVIYWLIRHSKHK